MNKNKPKSEFKQVFGKLWQQGRPANPYKGEPYTYYSVEDKVWGWIEKQLQQACLAESRRARQEGIGEVIGVLTAWCSMRIRDQQQTIDAEFLRERLNKLLKEEYETNK